jgi:Leucine-rich repeat (LRR) protein
MLFVHVYTQMGSPWERMPPDMAGEVMGHLKWDKGASALFRQTCKGWRDAHDENLTCLNVNGNSLTSSFTIVRTRFPKVKEIGVRFHAGPSFINTFYDEQWLQTLASLPALTNLDLEDCQQVTDDGLLALACLTALTNLNLKMCMQVSDDGLRALASLTALVNLNLGGCEQVSDDGLRTLDGLTALTGGIVSSARERALSRATRWVAFTWRSPSTRC